MPRTKITALLIDLNGTLHLGSKPTRNAVEAVRKLRAAAVPFFFCSNSTKESTASLLAKLNDMGFDVKPRELITSLGACRDLVQQRNLNPFLLLSDSAKEEFSDLPISATNAKRPFDSVILGLDPPSLCYQELNKAFRILKREPISHSDSKPVDGSAPVLIAPHASLYQQSPASDDMPEGLSLGIGPFVRALEVASGVEAELVGKPTKRFFELAIARMKELHGVQDGQLAMENIAVIGDDIVNDLGQGAKELGLQRILVKTGKYRPDLPSDSRPDQIVEDFSTFIDDLLA